jgi:hypothetical protein
MRNGNRKTQAKAKEESLLVMLIWVLPFESLDFCELPETSACQLLTPNL